MADGTSVPIGVIAPRRATARRSTMRKFAQRRSTTGFLLCLPLILLVAGFVIYPAFYAHLSEHAEQEDDHVRRIWATSSSC